MQTRQEQLDELNKKENEYIDKLLSNMFLIFDRKQIQGYGKFKITKYHRVSLSTGLKIAR